jgi:hypothetical protein
MLEVDPAEDKENEVLGSHTVIVCVLSSFLGV